MRNKSPKVSNSIHGMSIKEQSRWLALIEAMKCILDECKHKKVDFDTLNLNVNTFKEYIDNMSVLIEDDLRKFQRCKIQIVNYKLKNEFRKFLNNEIHSNQSV